MKIKKIMLFLQMLMSLMKKLQVEDLTKSMKIKMWMH